MNTLLLLFDIAGFLQDFLHASRSSISKTAQLENSAACVSYCSSQAPRSTRSSPGCDVGRGLDVATEDLTSLRPRLEGMPV